MKKKSIGIIISALILVLGIVVISYNSSTPNYKNRSVNEWYTDVANGKEVITVFGASYCSHCHDYYPVISKLAKKYNFNLYFYDVDTLSKNNPDDYDTLMNSFEIKDYDDSFPFTFIMNNKEYKAFTEGFVNRDYTVNFLKENGIIKD